MIKWIRGTNVLQGGMAFILHRKITRKMRAVLRNDTMQMTIPYFHYPSIEMSRTGRFLRAFCRKRGLSARDIQEELELTSVQSVYDWFHGKTLPSLENLCALAQLLEVPAEALLIGRCGIPILWYGRIDEQEFIRLKYHRRKRSFGRNQLRYCLNDELIVIR